MDKNFRERVELLVERSYGETEASPESVTMSQKEAVGYEQTAFRAGMVEAYGLGLGEDEVDALAKELFNSQTIGTEDPDELDKAWDNPLEFAQFSRENYHDHVKAVVKAFLAQRKTNL